MKETTLRQKALSLFYPLLMKLAGKRAAVKSNEEKTIPAQSFYTLSTTLTNGVPFSFENLRGKKVLLVNTASDCGYTPQYKELQGLQERYKENLVVIGFPSNDFKEQEKGSDEAIAQFCQLNYGVQFLLAKKSVVSKNSQQNSVFAWLSDRAKNGWNEKPPSWNFSKYLVNEQGILTHYFDPAVPPLSNQVTAAIQQ